MVISRTQFIVSLSLFLTIFQQSYAVIDHAVLFDNNGKKVFVLSENGIEKINVDRGVEQLTQLKQMAKDWQAPIVCCDQTKFNIGNSAFYSQCVAQKLRGQKIDIIPFSSPCDTGYYKASYALENLVAQCNKDNISCVNCFFKDEDFEKIRNGIPQTLSYLETKYPKISKFFSDLKVTEKTSDLINFRFLEQICDKHENDSDPIIIVTFSNFYQDLQNCIMNLLGYYKVLETELPTCSYDNASKRFNYAIDIEAFSKQATTMINCPGCFQLQKNLQDLNKHFHACYPCKKIMLSDELKKVIENPKLLTDDHVLQLKQQQKCITDEEALVAKAHGCLTLKYKSEFEKKCIKNQVIGMNEWLKAVRAEKRVIGRALECYEKERYRLEKENKRIENEIKLMSVEDKLGSQNRLHQKEKAKTQVRSHTSYGMILPNMPEKKIYKKSESYWPRILKSLATGLVAGIGIYSLATWLW